MIPSILINAAFNMVLMGMALLFAFIINSAPENFQLALLGALAIIIGIIQTLGDDT